MPCHHLIIESLQSYLSLHAVMFLPHWQLTTVHDFLDSMGPPPNGLMRDGSQQTWQY